MSQVTKRQKGRQVRPNTGRCFLIISRRKTPKSSTWKWGWWTTNSSNNNSSSNLHRLLLVNQSLWLPKNRSDLRATYSASWIKSLQVFPSWASFCHFYYYYYYWIAVLTGSFQNIAIIIFAITVRFFFWDRKRFLCNSIKFLPGSIQFLCIYSRIICELLF